MCRTCVYASLMIVTWPGVRRNSSGYGWFMIAGKPGGKQFAVGPSALSRGVEAALAAYSGVSDGPATAPRPRPPALAPPCPPAGVAPRGAPAGAPAGAAPRGLAPAP